MTPKMTIVDDVEASVHATLASEYRIEGLLGRGGMSIVFLARELSLNRLVAMKVLPLKLAREERAAERFQQEATIAASLDHPHVTPVHRIGASAEFHWYTMKYIRGLSLEETLRDMGRLDYHSCLSLIEQAASALDHAHRKGIIHRDMKPGNVLLDESSWVYICDFGVAKIVSDAAKFTQTGGTIGTPAYMSPEQLYGKPVDSRSDQYSLAVMTFEMLTGRQPFVADSVGEIVRMHCVEPPPMLSAYRRDLPPRVTEGLMRALSKEPEERFASVIDFLTFIGGRRPPRAPQARVSVEATEAQTEPFAQEADTRWRAGHLPVGLAAAGVVLLAAAVVGGNGAANATGQDGNSAPLVQGTVTESTTVPPAVVAPGRLFVSTDPWGRLFIDGERAGNTPALDIPISAGRHVIRVVRDGYHAFEDTVDVLPDGEVRLTGIVLRRTP